MILKLNLEYISIDKKIYNTYFSKVLTLSLVND